MPRNNSRARREERRKDAEWRAANPDLVGIEARAQEHAGRGKAKTKPLTETLLSGKRTPKGAHRRYGADR